MRPLFAATSPGIGANALISGTIAADLAYQVRYSMDPH